MSEEIDVADEFARSKFASSTARNVALLAEVERLRKALKDAAISLQTVSRLAGRSTYEDNIPTYMGTFEAVRAYARTRSDVAFIAIATGEQQ